MKAVCDRLVSKETAQLRMQVQDAQEHVRKLEASIPKKVAVLEGNCKFFMASIERLRVLCPVSAYSDADHIRDNILVSRDKAHNEHKFPLFNKVGTEDDCQILEFMLKHYNDNFTVQVRLKMFMLTDECEWVQIQYMDKKRKASEMFADERWADMYEDTRLVRTVRMDAQKIELAEQELFRTVLEENRIPGYGRSHIFPIDWDRKSKYHRSFIEWRYTRDENGYTGEQRYNMTPKFPVDFTATPALHSVLGENTNVGFLNPATITPALLSVLQYQYPLPPKKPRSCACNTANGVWCTGHWFYVD